MDTSNCDTLSIDSLLDYSDNYDCGDDVIELLSCHEDSILQSNDSETNETDDIIESISFHEDSILQSNQSTPCVNSILSLNQDLIYFCPLLASDTCSQTENHSKHLGCDVSTQTEDVVSLQCIQIYVFLKIDQAMQTSLAIDSSSQVDLPLTFDESLQTVDMSNVPPTVAIDTIDPAIIELPDTIEKSDAIDEGERAYIYGVMVRNRFEGLVVEDCADDNTVIDTSDRPTAAASKMSPSKQGINRKVSPRKTAEHMHTVCPNIDSPPIRIAKPRPSRPVHDSTGRTQRTPIPLKNQYKVLIIGDSIPKYLDGTRMSRRLTVLNRCIPGTSISNWLTMVPALIQQEKPTSIIIHCGTNNIRSNCPGTIASLMFQLCSIIRDLDRSIKIAVSGLTPRGESSADWAVRQVNGYFSIMCDKNNYIFISNCNIVPHHLARDGIHLTQSGVIRLAMNFISFLRSFLYLMPKERNQNIPRTTVNPSMKRSNPDWLSWLARIKSLSQ